MQCICSVCDAVDAQTKALVLHSGVHQLFVSVLKDPEVSTPPILSHLLTPFPGIAASESHVR
jgi:hypothetical protein